MSINALLNHNAPNFQSDSQEMLLTVVDAKHATSHRKFQIKQELDALLDQELTVTALKEDLLTDTLVSNAHLAKSETQLMSTNRDASTHLPVTKITPSNSELMPETAVDAKSALSIKFQTSQELLVLLDHLLFAVALRDNLKMDSHAKTAQPDKSKLPTTQSNAIPLNVPDSTPSELPLTTFHVEDVPPAHGQHKFQMPPDLDVSTDHLPTAQTADRDNQMMDTHAKPAQLDKSKIQTMPEHVMPLNALDNMTSNFQLILNHAEDARHANGQDKFQTKEELLVSTDHSSNAQTASPEDHKITTPVRDAQLAKFKTQIISIDVSQEPVVDNTKFNLHMTLNHVEDARTANGQDSCQINSRLNALLDHLPYVDADPSNQPMDTLARPAQPVTSKISTILRDVSDQTAVDKDKSNSQLIKTTVEDVRPANGHNSFQTVLELNALPDHLLLATARAEDQPSDTHARDAQPVKSKTQIT
jgi:hypothetical protein